MKQRTFKQFLALFLCGVLMLCCLSGCGEKAPQETNPTGTVPAETNPPETKPAETEPVTEPTEPEPEPEPTFPEDWTTTVEEVGLNPEDHYLSLEDQLPLPADGFEITMTLGGKLAWRTGLEKTAARAPLGEENLHLRLRNTDAQGKVLEANWESNRPEIVTMDVNELEPHAAGTALITGEYDGKTYHAIVHVVEEPEDVTEGHRNDKNRDYVQEPLRDHTLTQEEKAFFRLFWELDQNSMLDYVKEHPEAVEKGWAYIDINEAGVKDKGTDIQTLFGEQVLAINAQEGILIVRVTGSTYRGVLAIAKDPAKLRLCPAEKLGSKGEHAGSIAERNGGILAMTASGFLDPGGNGNGGAIAGACMCEGQVYGTHYGSNFDRIELREDNRMYLMKADAQFGPGTTDAAEFAPAMVEYGVNVAEGETIFVELNPRACIGQTSTGEILLLMVEGRLSDSKGANVKECAEILLLHDCVTAMNMDGGTSAVMWYDGKYITRCSNRNLDEGRYLPNAWVYG